MIRTDIHLTWQHRLALLLGGKLSVTWRAGAVGPVIVNVNVEMGKPKEVEA